MEALIRQTTPDKAAKNCQDVLEYYGAHETGRASKIAANYICDILDKYPVIRAKRLWVEEAEEGEFRDMPMEFHNDLIDALSARASMSDVI